MLGKIVLIFININDVIKNIFKTIIMLNKIKPLLLTISILLIIISVVIFLLGIESCRYDCNCSKMCRKEVCCSKKCDKLLQFLKINSCPDKNDVSNFKFEKINETNINDKIIYLNKEFGFELTLTENWKDYCTDLKKYENTTYIKFFSKKILIRWLYFKLQYII